MITEAFIDSCLMPIHLLLTAIGVIFASIDMQIPSGLIDWVGDRITDAWYFLPMNDLLIIFGLWIILTSLNVIMSIFKLIWGFIPFKFT